MKLDYQQKLDLSSWINFAIALFNIILAIIFLIFYFAYKTPKDFKYRSIHLSTYFFVIFHSSFFILTFAYPITQLNDEDYDLTFFICQFQGFIRIISILAFLIFAILNILIFLLENTRNSKLITRDFIIKVSIICSIIPIIITLPFLFFTHMEIFDSQSCFIANFNAYTIFVIIFAFLYFLYFSLLSYVLYKYVFVKNFFRYANLCQVSLNLLVLITLVCLLIHCRCGLFYIRGGNYWNFSIFGMVREITECLTGLGLMLSFQVKDEWEGFKWMICYRKKQIVDDRFNNTVIDY